MRLIKSFVLASTLILPSLALLGCDKNPEKKLSEQPSSIEKIKQQGVLRVGVFADNPPFGYVDQTGQHQGFDVALAQRVAQDLLGESSKIEYVITEAANRVEFLKSDKFCEDLLPKILHLTISSA